MKSRVLCILCISMLLSSCMFFLYPDPQTQPSLVVLLPGSNSRAVTSAASATSHAVDYYQITLSNGTESLGPFTYENGTTASFDQLTAGTWKVSVEAWFANVLCGAGTAEAMVTPDTTAECVITLQTVSDTSSSTIPSTGGTDDIQISALSSSYGNNDYPGNISYTDFYAYGQIALLNNSFIPETTCFISDAEWMDEQTENPADPLFSSFTVVDNIKYVRYCRFMGLKDSFALQLLYYDDVFLPQVYGDALSATVYGIGSCGILASITSNNRIQYYLFLTQTGMDMLFNKEIINITFDLFSNEGLSVDDVTSANLTLQFINQ